MSTKDIVAEAIAKNPEGLRVAVEKELQERVVKALAEKKIEVEVELSDDELEDDEDESSEEKDDAKEEGED